MTDRTALYAAVCANPEDDTVRLAFADFLEENGDAKRAAFIRTQVAAHAAREADTPAAALFRYFSYEGIGGHSVDWAAVDPELAAVFAADRNASRGKLSARSEGLPKLAGVKFQGHQRGFFHQVRVTNGEAFVRHAAAIFRAAPITDVEFDDLSGDGAKAVAASGYLGRVRWLSSNSGMEPDALEVLGRHPDAAGIRELHLDGLDGSVEQLAALAAGRHWTGLRKLELIDFDEGGSAAAIDRAAAEAFRRKQFRGLEEISAWGCALGTETARAIAAGKFPSLRKLDLGINRIPTAGGEALAAAKGMPGLRYLDLSSNDIRSGEVMANLIASPNFPELTLLKLDGNSRLPGPKAWPTKSRGPSLRVLQLEANTLGESGAETLFAQPALKGLWWLDVSDCGLTDRGLRALGANLDQLMAVNLRGNPISGAALAEFVNRPAAARLQWLDLYDVKLGTAGVNALVNSEHLANLKHLGVTGRGLTRLVKRFGRKVVG